ncbi:hypothetical protein RMATCC62417_10605 [Rhizopus microsporus]|nr:hypothetical protein RMATCC62417_10605 [Rhizopus microsporus]
MLCSALQLEKFTPITSTRKIDWTDNERYSTTTNGPVISLFLYKMSVEQTASVLFTSLAQKASTLLCQTWSLGVSEAGDPYSSYPNTNQVTTVLFEGAGLCDGLKVFTSSKLSTLNADDMEVSWQGLEDPQKVSHQL